MTDQKGSTEGTIAKEPVQTIVGRNPSRAWWWMFILLSVWVLGIRTGCLSFIFTEIYTIMIPPVDFDQVARFVEPEFAAWLDHTSMMSGILLYPVQILGVAVIPALLAKLGILHNDRTEKRITIGFLMLSFAMLPIFLFVRGIINHTVLLYVLLSLFALCPSAALGLTMRRGALHWKVEKVALFVGLVYLLDHVCRQLGYYSWMATLDAAIYLGYSYVFFGGLLIAAAVLRMRMRYEAAPAQPPTHHVYPQQFPRNICILLSVHALFSSAINTIIYFDNRDFHTPEYELFFYILAFFVMLAVTILYHRGRWLAPTLVGLLLVCFGQGLALFNIESIQLAIAYNLVTMIGKVPSLILVMIVPLYYAVGTRKPGLACLGFTIPAGADFLLNLTQLTENGISGVLPGNARQGALLFVGLCIIGALFYLYTQFERSRTNGLLTDIREGLRDRRSTHETVETLDLTAREKEVTLLLLAGDSQKMIAAKLSVSLSTVSFHIRNLYRKLNIQSKGELFALFLDSESSDVA